MCGSMRGVWVLVYGGECVWDSSNEHTHSPTHSSPLCTPTPTHSAPSCTPTPTHPVCPWMHTHTHTHPLCPGYARTHTHTHTLPLDARTHTHPPTHSAPGCTPTAPGCIPTPTHSAPGCTCTPNHALYPWVHYQTHSPTLPLPAHPHPCMLPLAAHPYVPDNTKMWGEVDTLEGRERLQLDLDRLQKWADENRMGFNVDKCRVLHLGRRHPQHTYRPGSSPLESTEVERDLGVIIDSKMNMSCQCQTAASKASQTLSCIQRCISSWSGEVILPLYVTVVRPQLEYCIQYWAPHFKRDVASLERVQRRPPAW
ncbi:uncharacterized protein LOC132246649 [Alligator mississippiensis]|uniref:uncharacterized protein LOC132246649 n=1 Tax=Alligator mississippiensis TaxID=8496 RepID=UPI002877F9DD|nr:uncharacterized protein LOC132246649 [Alligator mississippiensis]XP_059576043.1 uncharacterized protein LOC132246649 [Alligator mississippiensis]XP_059576044.1 uncharacterized protein LOC132246649 [Alligator mississippiensis]XP_059576045.1 uncharacterized protein LOC132246649 [Alligator mississippiensis]XP_059576046.1 uncharacterized protein LOC132246649 [Alligator mississippiensis]XP_059576047.1 uncharacterized protein LOC132246649 [Alligator mississippiensis]